MNLPRTSLFAGRDIFLQTLHTNFVESQVVVVSGANGVGKTSALQAYIRRFAQNYQAIIWLNAATDETFLADLIASLQIYSLPIEVQRGSEYLFRTLHHYMSQQQDVLFLLDNFSSRFTLQGLSEQALNIHIGMITQGQQIPAEAAQVALTGLDDLDGACLLLRLAGLLSSQETLDQVGDELRDAALELVGAFHGMPITLYLAGCYLSLTGSSVQEYLSTFRAAPVPGYLPAGIDKDAIQPFVVVCEGNLKYIRETDASAFERLQLAALLLPDDIPSALFLSAHERDVTENETEQESQIMRRLLDAGLISVTQQTSLVSIHRLIQDVILQALTDEQRQQGSKQLVLLVHQSLPQIQSEPLSIRIRVAGQIRHLASLSEGESAFFDVLRDVNEAAEVFTWAATLFWEQQLAGMAEPLLRRALRIWIHTVGDTHPTVANVLANLASINGLLKNYPEAEAFAHRAIASKTSALGINHPDVILTLDQLGRLYAEQGKQQEALQCYEKAIEIGEAVQLRRHPIFITAKYHLALLYKEQEKWEEAATLLRRVCIARVGSLGNYDPDTMEAWFSLVDVVMQQKDWGMAAYAYERALIAYEPLYGEEDLMTLDHWERLSNILLQLGKVEEARQYLQRIQEVKERMATKNVQSTL